MMSRRHAALSLAAALACCATARADITYTDLFTLAKPAGYSYAGPYTTDGVHVIAAGQVSGNGSGADNTSHALLWTASNPAGEDFDPPLSNAYMLGTNGTQQFGSNGAQRAMLWNNSPSSAVLLPQVSPNSFDEAIDVRNGQIVGRSSASFGSLPHAVLWASSNSSAIDLNPEGYNTSIAYATDGSQQVGEANLAPAGSPQAALWNGSAGSFKNLNPVGYSYSEADAVRNGQQVGVAGGALTQNHDHAMMWTGSAESAVDLNPSGFVTTSAADTDGIRQVGSGSTVEPVDPRVGITPSVALLWNGSPDDYINLGAMLPSNFVASTAISIESDQVYGLATDTDGNFHAIVWSVPEPTSLALLGLAGVTLLSRRRRTTGVLRVA